MNTELGNAERLDLMTCCKFLLRCVLKKFLVRDHMYLVRQGRLQPRLARGDRLFSSLLRRTPTAAGRACLSLSFGAAQGMGSAVIAAIAHRALHGVCFAASVS